MNRSSWCPGTEGSPTRLVAAPPVKPVTNDFSRDHLLKLFTSAPKAFWRHDVDISLEAAVRMARFAQLAGVQSTFYLNPRSDWYNLFAGDGRHTVREILKAGHRLGVHVDVQTDPESSARNDIDLVKSWYGPETFGRRVSFHMPPKSVLWRDFGSFENAYAARWEGLYVSDSRGVPVAAVSNGMQVCLHPEHWPL